MLRHAFDSVHWYLEEVGAQVVAKSGIPSDRYHFGKIILHNLMKYPDFVLQIDGSTGESETCKSVAERTVRCAVAIEALGLKTGDVMVLMSPNHLDLCIPFYAGLLLGLKTAPVDYTLGVQELQDTFNILQPRLIFCQSEKVKDVEKALSLNKSRVPIVVFNDTFQQFLKNADKVAIKNFKPADFDTDKEFAILLPTSGTTGTPKAACLSHKSLLIGLSYLWLGFSKFPTPTKMAIILSPLQWLSAGFIYLYSPILMITRLQTPAPITVEHYTELVNKYRPTFKVVSPPMMVTLTTAEGKCDFTSFECIIIGGSAVPAELITKVKRLIQSENVFGLYGLSEVSGVTFYPDYAPPRGSLGRPIGCLEYRLVDVATKKDVGVNEPGELWLRGPTLFKGYYNNPETTATTLTTDGWLMSGDILYRDEHWNFYFVDRLKLLLKYRNHQVSPLEVESVIFKHPGVLDVAVTGIPDLECGDLLVACVKPRDGYNLTAQEIKDIVNENLTESKHLHGGVIFLKEFPLTSSSKIDRRVLKQLAQTTPRE